MAQKQEFYTGIQNYPKVGKGKALCKLSLQQLSKQWDFSEGLKITASHYSAKSLI
jgi:hypothetical protein